MGRLRASVGPWKHGEGVQGSRRGFGFPGGRWGLPGGHGDMVTTARCAGELRGSNRVVTTCA